MIGLNRGSLQFPIFRRPSRSFKGYLKIAAQQFYPLGFGDKSLHFLFGEVRGFIAAKGYVEFAFTVVAAQAVEGMAV